MNNLLWVLNRLKSMSIREVLYRIKKYINNICNKIKYRNIIEVKNLVNKKIYLEDIDKSGKIIFKNVDQLKEIEVENTYDLFDKKVIILDRIDWHSGITGEWDKFKYSLDIDTKFTDEIGDIRYTWEINRHQFFPYIALLYKQTGEKKYYNTIKEYFYNWSNENYYLRGVNWLSSMEVAIRSYQWIITYYILDKVSENDFREDIIKSVIASIEYVSKNLSKYSSANNHLILEAVIMSIVGYCLDGEYNQDWFKKGYNILEKEISLQFNDDGVNKEQALHYQAFVIDAMLQYNFFLRKIGEKPIGEEIIYNSLKFIGSLRADKFNFDYGDSDDAKIISFSCEKKNYYQYILELGSIYYKEKFIEFDSISNEVKFISGINKIDELKNVEYEKSKLYREGGYLVINNNNDNLLMDVGELGFGAIAAHGHADALSIIYYNKNNPIIIDSGTYIYNIENEYRNYFRSTEAHNTLCYKGLNQSEIKGPFLWGKRANVKVIEYIEKDDFIKIKAFHDGYSPLIHTRELEYYFNNKIVIRDYFDDIAKVNFILDNNVELNRISDNAVEIISNDSKVIFKANRIISIEETIISKSFLTKEESRKIVIEKDFRGNSYLEVIIEPCNKI